METRGYDSDVNTSRIGLLVSRSRKQICPRRHAHPGGPWDLLGPILPLTGVPALAGSCLRTSACSILSLPTNTYLVLGRGNPGHCRRTLLISTCLEANIGKRDAHGLLQPLKPSSTRHTNCRAGDYPSSEWHLQMISRFSPDRNLTRRRYYVSAPGQYPWCTLTVSCGPRHRAPQTLRSIVPTRSILFEPEWTCARLMRPSDQKYERTNA